MSPFAIEISVERVSLRYEGVCAEREKQAEMETSEPGSDVVVVVSS